MSKRLSWSGDDFDKEIKDLLNARLPVSASKINRIREYALEHKEHRYYIVHSIIRFIEKAPAAYRVVGLFVINDIIKKANSKKHESAASAYRRRFSVVLYHGALDNLFDHCMPKDKARINRVLQIWRDGKVFSQKILDRVQTKIMQQFESPPEEEVEYSSEVAISAALSHPDSFDDYKLFPSELPKEHSNLEHPEVYPSYYQNSTDMITPDLQSEPKEDSIKLALEYFLNSIDL